MSLSLYLRMALLGSIAALFTACGTTTQSLDYSPDRAVGKRAGGRKNVSVGSFKDARNQADTYLGQVRQAGVAVHKLDTSIPVSQIVENTFGYGLATRGMNGNGAWRISGIIKEFSCDQVVRAGASAEITVLLHKVGDTQATFRKTYHAEESAATLKIGPTGDTQMLRELASEVLQRVVDKALDDAELRLLTDGTSTRDSLE
jgi:uncharacterized lipoprotein YajG